MAMKSLSHPLTFPPLHPSKLPWIMEKRQQAEKQQEPEDEKVNCELNYLRMSETISMKTQRHDHLNMS